MYMTHAMRFIIYHSYVCGMHTTTTDVLLLYTYCTDYRYREWCCCTREIFRLYFLLTTTSITSVSRAVSPRLGVGHTGVMDRFLTDGRAATATGRLNDDDI